MVLTITMLVGLGISAIAAMWLLLAAEDDAISPIKVSWAMRCLEKHSRSVDWHDRSIDWFRRDHRSIWGKDISEKHMTQILELLVARGDAERLPDGRYRGTKPPE